MNRLGDAPTDLLFGLIALQNDLVAPAVIPAALRALAREPGRNLADHLVAQGALTASQRELVDSLSGEYLSKHGGDAEKSVAMLIEAPSARERLGRLEDPELTETFDPGVTVGSARSGEEIPDRGTTTAYPWGGQRFRVLRRHARGGLGEVFVALDAELNREVALKRILDRHADDPACRQRFLIEAEITGGLEHPGIVPVYGLGIDGDGRPYYAMRFIKGDSLKEAIGRFHGEEALRKEPGRRSLESSKLLRRFLDVCNAIGYAHSRGILHRDIKPGNVIVGDHGETLLVDWGLAKLLGRVEEGGDSGERSLLTSSAGAGVETQPGTALGTPAYMSPEQARGELERMGPRSDVYSLGATLFCLLTGKPPFENEDIGALLRDVQEGRFPRPRQIDPSLDQALEAVCLKAMAAKAEDRYATPKALADDLERWMADEPVGAWREPFTRRARRWTRRNRTAVAAVAVALLAALAGLGAVAGVQAKANGELMALNSRLNRSNTELASEKARVQQRFEVAMAAIKTFHTGVSEDFLLKEAEFKSLRNRLLNSAGDFYLTLGPLLKDATDLPSRRALLARTSSWPS